MIKGVKKWLGVLALALGMASGAQAQVNIGLLSNYSTNATHSSSFSDVYNFSLPAGPSSLTTFLATLSFNPVIGFSSFSALLTGPSLNENLSASYAPAGPAAIGTIADTRSLGAGNYSLTVSGSPFSGASGSYTLNLIAAPVPEPAEWMMMAAGLLVMGFIARRRKNVA